jgi:hypothetical protein
MTYTRSYWQGLCKSVIGRDLHHDPTRGGGSETTKFADWYARTLDGYRRVFGKPPQDIWPPADRRFTPTRMQWVDLEVFRLVPRRRTTSRWAWLGVAAGGLGAIGCGTGGTMNDPTDGLGTFLCIFAAVVGVLILMSAALIKQNAAGSTTARRSRDRRTSSGGGCGGSPFIYTPGVFDDSGAPHGHGHGGHHGHGDGSSGQGDGHGHGCGHGHGGDGGGHGCASGDGGSSGCSSGGDSGGGCGGGGDGGSGCGGGGCGGGGCSGS